MVNADDFYGAGSFVQLAIFLKKSLPLKFSKPEFAMVGFRLGKTLSEHGAVSRGVCTVDVKGYLRDVEETTGILAAEVGTGPSAKYAPETQVSMNCWGFTSEFLPHLHERWLAFLKEHGSSEKTEFYLPFAVNDLLKASTIRVHVLPTESEWFGVTYREDKPRVQAAINALVAKGEYPSPLWK